MRERQEAGAPPATIRNELAALKRMFTLGVRAGKVAHRPHIPAIQVSNARQGFFDPEDFAAVNAELPDCSQAGRRVLVPHRLAVAVGSAAADMGAGGLRGGRRAAGAALDEE